MRFDTSGLNLTLNPPLKSIHPHISRFKALTVFTQPWNIQDQEQRVNSIGITSDTHKSYLAVNRNYAKFSFFWWVVLICSEAFLKGHKKKDNTFRVTLNA